MTDRELLEMAAKAAGIKILDVGLAINGRYTVRRADGGLDYWNPLTDDGDTFRLAVRLGMQVDIDLKKGRVTALLDEANGVPAEWFDNGQQTPEEATRRAIVRAAAELELQKDNKSIDNNEAAPTIPPNN